MMWKGNTVMIYQDPISRLKPEGRAKLMKLLREEDEDGMSRWEVHFPGEAGVFEREVLNPNR